MINKEDYIKRDPIAVDITGLQALLSVGKNTALQIGKDAGAVVHVGRKRTLYNVSKIKEYINALSGGEESGNNDI